MRTGDLAPDFTLPDQHGVPRSLSDFVERGPVALFFYPAALTAGCTKESCHFRDLGGEFAAVGAERVGISMDDVARQATFASKNDLDYPLLSDLDGRVAKVFGVKRALNLLKVKRVTFVVGTDRRILEVINGEINMTAHADRALAVLRSST